MLSGFGDLSGEAALEGAALSRSVTRREKRYFFNGDFKLILLQNVSFEKYLNWKKNEKPWVSSEPWQKKKKKYFDLETKRKERREKVKTKNRVIFLWETFSCYKKNWETKIWKAASERVLVLGRRMLKWKNNNLGTPMGLGKAPRWFAQTHQVFEGSSGSEDKKHISLNF